MHDLGVIAHSESQHNKAALLMMFQTRRTRRVELERYAVPKHILLVTHINGDLEKALLDTDDPVM